jgi:hypothetical protein
MMVGVFIIPCPKITYGAALPEPDLLDCHEQARSAVSAASSINHLTPKYRENLEKILATVKGRIRFNENILRMINDEKIPLKERMSEFYGNMGRELIANISEIDLQKIQKLAEFGTNQEIQTLTTTLVICNYAKSGKMDASKSGFFLTVNIYSTIIALELREGNLSKEGRQKSICSEYSERPYYKNMKRYLRESDLPKLHEKIGSLFIAVGHNIVFNFQNASLDEADKEIGKLEKLYKKYQKKGISEIATCHNERSTVSSWRLKRSQEALKRSKPEEVKILIYSHLLKYFNEDLWPYIETELAAEELLTALTEKESKYRELIKIRKPISMVSSTKDREAQAVDVEKSKAPLSSEQKEEIASSASSASIAHEETKKTEEAAAPIAHTTRPSILKGFKQSFGKQAEESKATLNSENEEMAYSASSALIAHEQTEETAEPDEADSSSDSSHNSAPIAYTTSSSASSAESIQGNIAYWI